MAAGNGSLSVFSTDVKEFLGLPRVEKLRNAIQDVSGDTFLIQSAGRVLQAELTSARDEFRESLPALRLEHVLSSVSLSQRVKCLACDFDAYLPGEERPASKSFKTCPEGFLGAGFGHVLGNYMEKQQPSE